MSVDVSKPNDDKKPKFDPALLWTLVLTGAILVVEGIVSVQSHTTPFAHFPEVVCGG